MNSERGEIAIRLGGQEIVLRPTFEALVEIEQQLGQGLVALARRMATRDIGLRDAAVIVRASMVDDKPPLAEVGRRILDQGLVTLVGPLAGFIAGALSGGAQPNPQVPAATQPRSSGSPAGA